MDGYGYRPKKRYRIKYKNVAILLAILLLIILLITKGCSALFSKDKEKEDDTEADVSQSEGPDVPDDGVSLTDAAEVIKRTAFKITRAGQLIAA